MVSLKSNVIIIGHFVTIDVFSSVSHVFEMLIRSVNIISAVSERVLLSVNSTIPMSDYTIRLYLLLVP